MMRRDAHEQTQTACCCIYLQGQKGALSGELVADAVTDGDYSRLALGVRAPLRVQQLASGQYRGVCEPPVPLPSPARAWVHFPSLLCKSSCSARQQGCGNRHMHPDCEAKTIHRRRNL